MHRIYLRWEHNRRSRCSRCSRRLRQQEDGPAAVEQSIPENSARSVVSRARRDRGPAAVEQQTPVNSVRNAENRDHKHCGRNNVWIQ